MNRATMLVCSNLLIALSTLSSSVVTEEPNRPNVVVILADDQGYGDVQALNPDCGVATPNTDRLCAEGTVFREAYSGSAFCTPSRYSLLTGRYAWRTYAKIGFPQDPLNFAPDPVPDPLPPFPSTERATIPKMLASLGYRNAVVGKWHLVTPPEELDFHYSFLHDGYFRKTQRFREQGREIDYTAQLHYPPSLAPGTTHAEMIAAGQTLTNDDIGLVLPETTDRAIAFIEDHLDQHAERPFFLYFAPHSLHTPYNVPSDYDGIDFTQKHATGPKAPSTPHNYPNFLALHDYCIGKLLAVLDEHEIADETIVIYASDNGGLGYAWSTQISPDAGPPHNAPRGSVGDPRYTSRPWNVNADRYGFKTMSHDGGSRVPLIVRWPEHVSSGRTDDTPRCLTDVFMTLAELLHVQLPHEAAEDSVSFADVLLGRGSSPRPPVVHHSRHGHLGLRMGSWKLIHADGHGGGGTHAGVKTGTAAERWTVDPTRLQLYDLSRSKLETAAQTVAEGQADVVRSMVTTLEAFWGADGVGRSRPDAPVPSER